MKLVSLIFLGSILSLGATITIDFDNLADSEVITAQYAGLTFTQAIALSGNGSLNTLLFSPRSDSNVASDFGGPIEIDFSSPVDSFAGYFTYATALTLQAFDIHANVVATTSSAFTDNTLVFGEAGSSPNELLTLASSAGISRITITGDAGGNSFTLDDLTAEAIGVPEPGTMGLLLISLLLGAVLKLRAHRLPALLGVIAAGTGVVSAQPAAIIRDLSHYSSVFQETRNYRILLPPDYDQSTGNRYPVVYFFHGFGERYNQTSDEVGNYDTGYAGDNLSAFAGSHNVIIVRPDGFNPRFPGDNRPRPYNVCPFDFLVADCTPGDTNRDFPAYFVELMNYIDTTYRTNADRDHRGTSGISMGGWMSYWLASKYPHLIGSASNFMGGPEFVAGAKEFATELSPNQLYRNFEGQQTRFITGTNDFIRWYHREMHKIWNYTRSNHEVEEFVSAHGTPGIARTLGFHMNAFANPLPRPLAWSHADIYPAFQVWGYSINSNRKRAGFTLLEDVSPSGFRSSVREFLPNGRLLSQTLLNVLTDAVYLPNANYQVTDIDPDTGQRITSTQNADSAGRLQFSLKGNRHEIGIAASPSPVLSLIGWRLANQGLAMAGQTLRFRLSIVNKGSALATAITASVSSPNAQVTVTPASVPAQNAGIGQIVETSQDVQVLINDPQREIVTLNVHLEAGGATSDSRLYIPLVPAATELPGVVISDGATKPLWKHANFQENGAMGTGNGDGIPSPGESIAFQMQDGAAFRSAEVLAADSCVDLTYSRGPRAGTEYSRYRLRDQWGTYDGVGATQKVSIPILSSSCAAGKEISFFVRFIFPDAPEHIIKQGVVKLRLAGKDTTPPEVLGAQVLDSSRLEVEIRDGGIVTTANARFDGLNGTFRFTLRDDGTAGDVTAADAIYAALISGMPSGSYSLVVETTDYRGNSAQRAIPGAYIF